MSWVTLKTMMPMMPMRTGTIERERRESNHAFIPGRHYPWGMLFLSAFARFVPPEPQPNDLLAHSRAALGHLGLTVIAIVFVLVTFWKS
jgi:hypothetical protein